MDPERLFNALANDTLKYGVCRVCLEENECLFSIFESSYDIYKPISTIFELFFSQEIKPGDGYPEVVCFTCLDKAVKALEFKTKFDKAHRENQEKRILENEVDLGIILIVQNEEGENSLQEIKKERNVEETLKINEKVSNTLQFFCQKCGIPFFTMEALSSHMVLCFKCDICEATHTNPSDLKIHKNIHKRNKETLCPECGDILKRGYHSSDSFKFNCQLCNFVFPCSVYLDQHIKFKHKNKASLKWNDGEKENDLNSNTNRYKCNLCNKTFSTMLRVNVHMASLNCIYICDVCGAQYTIKSQLKIHIMDKHLGVKPHLCCVCGKSFVRRGMLISHQQTHSQEKRFHCKICHKKFVSSATLRYHSRLHTGEKPYICTLCGEGFVKSSRLREHEQKWHIGKLQCPKCMTTFSQRCSLKTHMDRFHPNTYDRKQNYLMSQEKQEEIVEEGVIEQNDILFTDINTIYTIHITE